MSCVHQFLPDKTYTDYDRCENCGTYHRKDHAEKLEKTPPEFWSHNALRHIPEPLETETSIVVGIGINTLPVVETLYTLGYGVIMSLQNENDIPAIAAKMPESIIVQGLFPPSTAGMNDGVIRAIVSTNTLEYTDDYIKFFDEVKRLLSPGGVAIITCPVLLKDKPELSERITTFDSDWVFSEKFLSQYLEDRFSSVRFDQPAIGFELIIVTK